MDGDKVNRWLTLSANIGVLIGIILILAELNQNADLMRAQMTQARGDNVMQTYREMMLSNHWVEIRAKGRAAPSTDAWIKSLSPVEYERVWYRQLMDYHDLRTQFYQYQSGYLDEQIWRSSSRGQARRFMQKQPYFTFSEGVNESRFDEFLNEIARESGLPPMRRAE
jgi:hypothetical protein